jgi:hypothetical protein
MKKYLFGLLAIALAIGFSAFTIASKVKKTPTVKFEFHGLNETEFQTAGKWLKVVEFDITCDDFASDKTVCTLDVDQAIALTVTNETSLVSYLNGYLIDTYSEIDNSQNRGIYVVEAKEREEE